MKLDPRTLLRFTVTFMLLFAAFLAAYPWIMKAYQPAVFGSANLILKFMDPPTRIEITFNGSWRAYNLEQGYKRSFQSWKKWVQSHRTCSCYRRR